MLGAGKLDVPMAFETLQAAGSALGTGGLTVMDVTPDMVEAARHIANFYATESCGRCVPCRLGTTRIAEILGRLAAGRGAIDDVSRLRRYSEGLRLGALCPMGQAAPLPILSALDNFEPEFRARVARIARVAG
jgi:NADH:ubiquinone oxidoreductase subunit F (NADH-binding)